MKRKLFLFLCALLTSVGMWATDYLTNFSDYTVTKTAVSNDATSGTAREFWRNAILGFDVYGSSTTIPNGVYSFSMQGMYRGHLTNDIPTGIIAYAESDGAQYMAPICNKTDGTVSTISLAGFNTAFNGDANNYLNKIPYIIVTDGKIKVGVKSMSTQPFCDNGMWFVFNTASFKVSDVTDGDVLATALADIKAQAAGLLASNSDESTARSNLQTAYNSATATAADIVNVKQKIDAYLAKLVEIAEQEHPLDVSYYFTNPKYSIRNLDLVGGLVTSGKVGALGQPFGWTCFDAGGYKDNGSGNKFQEGQGFNWFTTIGNTTELDGQAANYDAEKSGGYSIYQRISWNQWAEQTHSAKQTVTLPAGKYKISVPAYASAKDDDYKGYVIFNINGTEYNNEVTAGSWNVYEKEFILGASAEVSVDMQFNKLRRDQDKPKQYAYFDGVKLLAYGDPVKAKKAELEALQATITDEAYFNNAAYTNVIGTERTDLTAAKSTTAASETFEAYETAIASVQGAIDAFVAAKTNYDALVAEIAKAKVLGIATATADGYAATSSSTAASALTNTQNLKVAEYNYVTTNYAYGVSLGEWTSTGTNTSAATFSNEHWSGETHDYKNQKDDWGNPKQGYAADSWSIIFSQDVVLPAGNYVFKVAGRQASGDKVVTSLVVKKGEDVLGTVSDFPRSNNSRGINKSGATSFDPEDAAGFANDGKGYGWEWRYVKFTLASDATVNIAINSVATAASQWVSFGDYTLQTDDEANISLIAYNIALNNANIAINNASYTNVTGSEKTELQAAIDADGTLDKTDKVAIDAAKDVLVAATTAFTGAKSDYDAYVAAKAAEFADDKPYASAAKYAAIATAQAAADATSAADAVTKTNAIYSAYRLYVESNALAEGVAGAESVVISDPNMEVEYDSENHTFGAWQVIGQTNGNIQLLNSESFTDGNGKNDYKYADIYKSDNNAGIQQTVELNKGRYLLTVTARAKNTDGASFWAFAGDNTTNINRIGNSGGVFGRGWNDASVEFLVYKDDTDVNIGVQSGNGKDLWWGATRFRLVRLGDAFVSATIGDTGWTTFASSNALNLSDITASTGDAAAYYASAVNGETVTVTSTDQAAVKAGEGIMLKGTAGATISIPIVLSGSAITGNMLVGCTSNTTITNATEGYSNIYVLGIKSGTTDVAEFQNVKSYIDKSNTVDIPAGKAYLKSTDASGRSLTIVDADEIITGVDAVEAASKAFVKEGKFIENGKLVIFMKGMKFNANGQVIK